MFFKRLSVYVTLYEIETKVQPKNRFHKFIKVVSPRSMQDSWVERDDVHCRDAGVTDKNEDQNVENCLVFVITTYNDFIFARLFFKVKISLCRKNFFISLDINIVRMCPMLNGLHNGRIINGNIALSSKLISPLSLDLQLMCLLLQPLHLEVVRMHCILFFH